MAHPQTSDTLRSALRLAARPEEIDRRVTKLAIELDAILSRAKLVTPRHGNVEARVTDADTMVASLGQAKVAISHFLHDWVEEADAFIGAIASRPILLSDFGKDAFDGDFDVIVDELENFARSTEVSLQLQAAE